MATIERAREWARALWKPGDTLSQRVVRGGFWVFALRITDRLLKLIRTIVLARVLAPSDFGLMGIALLAMSALEAFSQTGFQAALIQKKEDIEDYLDTAWTISTLRGFVLFAILCLAAPYIALFFDAPAAMPILRVIGISMLLSGLTNIGVVYFQKELEFNKQFVYQLSGTMADLVVAIAAVFLLRSVWALVLGLLAENFVRFAMSYLIHPYRPRVRFEVGKAKELYGFGQWVLGSSILIFLITQGDDALVGKILGTTALGFYQLAYRFSNIPATEITHVISQVTFPAYSKLQGSMDKLRNGYLQATQLTLFISFPIAAVILVMAPQFTEVFLGEKWKPMVPAMQILAIFGIIRSFGATTGPLFQGVGEPRVLTKLAFLQLVILAMIILPLTRGCGIIGTSVAVVIPNAIVQCLAAFRVIKLIQVPVSDFLKLFLLPAMGALAMMICIELFTGFSSVNLITFLGSIGMGIIVYVSSIYALDKAFSYHLQESIKQVVGFIR